MFAADDVVLLYEEKPTAEQVERARKLMLPDTFYLYENRPGCPGCIGCEDNLLTQSPLSKKGSHCYSALFVFEVLLTH